MMMPIIFESKKSNASEEDKEAIEKRHAKRAMTVNIIVAILVILFTIITAVPCIIFRKEYATFYVYVQLL